MDVAVNSTPFMEAKRRTHDLLNNESSAASTLDGTQFIFKVCCVGLVGLSTLWTVILLFNLSRSAHVLDFKAENIGRLALLCGIFGAYIGFSFMNVFDAVGDTTFFCFTLEHRRQQRREHLSAQAEAKPVSWWGYMFGEMESESDEEQEFGARGLHKVIKAQGKT